MPISASVSAMAVSRKPISAGNRCPIVPMRKQSTLVSFARIDDEAPGAQAAVKFREIETRILRIEKCRDEYGCAARAGHIPETPAGACRRSALPGWRGTWRPGPPRRLRLQAPRAWAQASIAWVGGVKRNWPSASRPRHCAAGQGSGCAPCPRLPAGPRAAPEQSKNPARPECICWAMR